MLSRTCLRVFLLRYFPCASQWISLSSLKFSKCGRMLLLSIERRESEKPMEHNTFYMCNAYTRILYNNNIYPFIVCGIGLWCLENCWKNIEFSCRTYSCQSNRHKGAENDLNIEKINVVSECRKFNRFDVTNTIVNIKTLLCTG